MLLALLTFAATEAGHETDKTAFYALGGLLALFAVAVSAVGIKRHESFPASTAQFRGVIALTFVLVAAALASAVLTS